MRKDPSIWKLLDMLKGKMGPDQITVEDHWDGDLCAIGLRKGNKLVYVCTYPYLKANPPRYDYDLDVKDETGEHFKTMKSVRGASEESLIMEIEMFLDV